MSVFSVSALKVGAGSVQEGIGTAFGNTTSQPLTLSDRVPR